jgi:hypothetical protein
MLAQHYGQAHRTRQRRVMIADHPGQNLRALAVMDNAIDRLILASSLYDDQASQYFAAQLAAAKPGTPALAAAVFLRLALAVQHTEPAPYQINTASPSREIESGQACERVIELAEQFLPSHPREVLEALWFFPMPTTRISAGTQHIARLFERAKARPHLLPLALELAGRCDVKALHTPITALLEQSAWAAAAMLALARMGQPLNLEHLAMLALGKSTASNEPDATHATHATHAWRDVYLNLVACQPRLAQDATLAELIQRFPNQVEVAWAILAVRHPRYTLEQALAQPALAAPLRLRVVAQTGYPDAVIHALAPLAETEKPASPGQRDLLATVLGNIPAEVRAEPDAKAGADAKSVAIDNKSASLRRLLLRTLRAAHVPIQNDAELGPWLPQQILQALPADAAASTARLRTGALFPLNATQSPPPLGAAVLDYTHAMRQWAYIERAELTGLPLALSALDVFRRQQLALMIAANVADQ